MRPLLARLLALLHRRQLDEELSAEISAHLDFATADNVARGMPPEEARRSAARRFGGALQTAEACRDRQGFPLMNSIWRDLRYAVRALRKTPAFTIVALLTLALGIGASTAVFTIVDSVILKPLTYSDSGRLVVAWERVRFLSPEPTGPNPRHVDVWRKRATAFSGLALLRQRASGLTLGNEHPQAVWTVGSSPELLDVLQVAPLLGRGFVPEDGVEGHDRVAILTYALWQRVFHGDPQVIGTTVRVGDTAREVIGVLPASFHFPNANALRAYRSRQSASSVTEPAIFIPVAMDLSQFGWNGEYGNWIAVGRLRAGMSIGQTESQLNVIESEIAHELSANERDNRSGALSVSVESLQDAVVGDSKTRLLLLMAAVMGLMLLACVNLANAQLGRALSRHREAAVRAALGAARWRLVWSALAETLLLAAIGGPAGVLLAGGVLRLFRAYSPIDVPRLSEVHVDASVFLFALALTCASSVVFSLLPALQLLRTDPQASLQKTNGRSLGSQHSRRLRHWLIGLQVFGCTVLLLNTGLFSKSLLYLIHQDKGFETGRVAIAQVDLSRDAYPTDQSRTAFDDAVLQNLRDIPGVQSAALVSAMPLEGQSWIDVLHRVDKPSQDAPLLNLRWISPGYFETVGQTLVAGRVFEERDRNLHSVILSESEARALWQNENPIGGHVETEGRRFTVVGIVGDSHNTSLKSPPVPMAYLHYQDRPPYSTFFIARGEQSAEALVPGIREAIWRYAPDVTIGRTKTLDSQLNDSLVTERFETSVLMSFAVAALLLAMLGIYGVLNHSTVTRTQEFGVRMALGATRREIYRLTALEAGIPFVAGLGAGVITNIMAARAIQSFLYGTKAIDVSVILMVTALFLVAAGVAAFVPARRAASVDPLAALRSE